MKLLTFDNAKSLLEKGEVYRIGYNALNEGEFLYEHKGFKRKDPSYSAQVNKGNGNLLYLNGTVTWLDKIDLGTMETDYRFFSSKAKTIQRFNSFRLSFPDWGVYCMEWRASLVT
jgi:hypothetical protein